MTSYNTADDATSRRMWDQRLKLAYRVRVGVLYHRKRERYFDLLDKVSKAVAIICASSAIATVLTATVTVYLQGAIVISSTLALVLAWSTRARVHSDLAVKYAQLEGALTGASETDFTDTDLLSWKSAFAGIVTGEPATLQGLVQLCQDELDMAAGHDVEIERLSNWRRFKAHLGFGTMPQPDVQKKTSPDAQEKSALSSAESATTNR